MGQALKTNGYQLYYWANERPAAEVDFVIQKEGKIVPIEVKTGEISQAPGLFRRWRRKKTGGMLFLYRAYRHNSHKNLLFPAISVIKSRLFRRRKGCYVNIPVNRGAVNRRFLSESVKIRIGGCQVDIRVIALRHNLGIASVKLHPHKRGTFSGIFLVIDEEVAYVKGVHPVGS